MSIDTRVNNIPKRGFFRRVTATIAALALGATIAYGCTRPPRPDDYQNDAITQTEGAEDYDTTPSDADSDEADTYPEIEPTADAEDEDHDSNSAIEPLPIEPPAYNDSTGTVFQEPICTPDDVLNAPLDELSVQEATGTCINDIFTPDYDLTISDKPLVCEPETVVEDTQPAGCFGETRVNFRYNSANFVDDAAAMRTLNEFVQRMMQSDAHTVYLDGFASEEGREGYNLRLSGRRTDRVADLIETIAVSHRYALEVMKRYDGETRIFSNDTLDPNRTVAIRTAPGTNPNEDAARAEELASHNAGEIYNIGCGAAAEPEADEERSTGRAIPTQPGIGERIEAPAHGHSAAAPHAPSHPHATAPHADETPAYTVEGNTVTLPNGASIQVITPGQDTAQMIQPAVEQMLEPTAGPTLPAEQTAVPTEPAVQTAEPAAPTVEPVAEPTSGPAAEMPEQLARRIEHLENYTTVVQGRVAPYVNLVEVIDNECGPGDTGAMLCTMQPYSAECNDGNPRVPTAPEEVTACRHAIIDTDINGEFIASDLDYLLNQITLLQNEIARIEHAPQAVEDRITNLQQLIETLDNVTEDAAESMTDSGAAASASSYTGNPANTDAGYTASTEMQTAARQQEGNVISIFRQPDLEHRAYDRPSYSGSGERFSAEDRQARRELAFEAYNSGTPVREIAEGLNVSRTTIYRDLRAYEQQTDQEYRLAA